MGMSGIYKIENIINNKVYIGKSEQLGIRWESHLELLTKGKHHSSKLQNDWNRYGISSFNFSILDITEENLSDKEQYFIEKFNSVSDGYNMQNAIKLDCDINYDINELLTTFEIDAIKKNITIIGNRKLKTNKPLVNNSYSIKWMSNDINLDVARRDLTNYHKNVFKANEFDAKWVSFDFLKNKVKGSMPYSNFSSDFDFKEFKTNKLIYGMNIYNNSKSNAFDIEFALYSILKWIKYNADIESEFTIYVPSERMEYILLGFVNRT